jgi:hypothetical protein
VRRTGAAEEFCAFIHLCLMADIRDMRWLGMLAMANRLIQAVAAYTRWSGGEERLFKSTGSERIVARD